MSMPTPMLPPPPHEQTSAAPLPDEIPPWSRQIGEDDVAWGKFLYYRDCPPPRKMVRPGCGAHITIAELSKKWRWHARVEAYDRHLQSIHDREIEAFIKQDAREIAAEQMSMLKDARELCSIVYARLLQDARGAEFATMKPETAVRLLEASVKLDRLIRGESTVNVQTETADLSNMSVDELRTAAELARKMSDGDKPPPEPPVH